MSLRHVILAVLSQETMTGYDITKQFDLVLGYFWRASHQQVYRELAALVDAELVRFRTVPQEGKPDKKVYAMTAKGKRELARWLKAAPDLPRLRDDLLVKLFAGETAGRDTLHDQIAQARVLHEKKLKTYLALEKEHFPQGPDKVPPFQRLIYLTLRHGVERERAWLRWSKQADDIIAGLHL